MEPIEFPEQSELNLFSTENTLKEIEAEVIAFPSSLSDLDNKYQEEMQKIREKFDKQRRSLREKHEKNIAKLAALKEQAQETNSQKSIARQLRPSRKFVPTLKHGDSPTNIKSKMLFPLSTPISLARVES